MTARKHYLAVAALLALLGSGLAIAASPALEATSSQAARDEATKAIPWGELDLQQQRMVRYLVRNASLYRRMPTRVIDCDPHVFNFLGQHPQVVTELWKMMGVCNLELEPIGPNVYRATDAAGTTGVIRVLSSSYTDDAQNYVLAYAEGTYQGAPFPREVTARSVLLLRSGSTIETNGRPYVTARLDSFVTVDRVGAELVAKTVQPLISKTADHNFTETMKFVSTFSQTAEKNPGGMGRLAEKLENLDNSTRAGMVTVCREAAVRYGKLADDRRDGRVRLVQRSESAEQ